MPPTPLKATARTWPRFPLLVKMMMVAVRVPSACGVNKTVTVSLLPASRVKDRDPLMLKSLALLPASSMLVTLTVVPPVLLMVSGRLALVLSGWFWKVSEAGTAIPVPVEPVPLPDNVTVCAVPPLLSVMVKLAAREPAVVGVNVTGMVAVPPLAKTVMGTIAVVEKSPLFAPENVRDVICTAAVPELVMVTGDGALLLATA